MGIVHKGIMFGYNKYRIKLNSAFVHNFFKDLNKTNFQPDEKKRNVIQIEIENRRRE